VRVSATWAQRAANAGNRYNLGSAPLIGVDGQAGPITIAALRTLSRQFAGGQPVDNDPETSRITEHVVMPVALETALSTKPFVPDPPISRATRRATPTSTAEAPATTPEPGATPPAPSSSASSESGGESGGGGRDEIILDAGSAGTARTILRKIGPWPLAIAAVALVGLGTYFVMNTPRQRAVAANRRRRMSRNGGDWIVPARGSSRFKTRTEADKASKWWSTNYGPGVFDAKVVKEPSTSRPGAYSYQVYIRPLHPALKSSLSKRGRVSRNPANSGDWIVPAGGSSRFKSRAEADKAAKFFRTHYGSGVFDAKVVKEPSKSRPGTHSYQVYIRPLHPALR
jgi:hypothetical protein